uniref:Uncharacterized protein n=1 Tax=Helicotheca tamesis TaxID=374047 RepID=A0A7S2MG39_9STRA|mmetsp:Transcript_15572/g.21275  ORF Transcript_15572/g.21275 Transcript_15572/m.21275 type:complete len:189 (+) Transcript_15572:115-681(+)
MSQAPPWASVGGHEAPYPSQQSNTTQSQPPKSPDRKGGRGKQVGGAAVAGTVAGFAIAGPLLAIVGGIGGAAAAATSSGKAGSVARASGDVVNAAGDRAKQIDQEHHIVEKSKKVGNSVAVKAREVDEEYQVVDKTRNAAVGAWGGLRDFNEKHQVLQKTGRGISASAAFISNAFSGGRGGKGPDPAL